MSDTVKLKLYSEIMGRGGANSVEEEVVDTEIPRASWEAMSEEERTAVGDEWWKGHVETRSEARQVRR
ncbi:DUF7167 family protein [[Actinomadura] parvosata]|uniref:DUF7167 family protein n=1 Tax=[Actinomadura] parvosata TaxID=1955412 RepID=UPI00406C3379